MSGRAGCELDLIAAIVSMADHACLRIPISVTWTYRRADPCAVIMSIPKVSVVWLLSRDLLVAGVEGGGGDGDVHLRTISGPDGDVTILTLGCGWDDEVSFSFATGDLIAFLALTDDVVPMGAESALVQADLVVTVAAWADGAEGAGAHP